VVSLTGIQEALRQVELEVAAIRGLVEQMQEGSADGPRSPANPMTNLGPSDEPHRKVRSEEGLFPVDREALRRTVDQMFKDIGIDDVPPTGAETLQALMRQEGVSEDDNSFSRGIIAMRDE